ncbi:MAG: hypothetical protein LBQ89_00720 [Treponema sp.]|nr:hypothetical protein [Treponema sp.]
MDIPRYIGQAVKPRNHLLMLCVGNVTLQGSSTVTVQGIGNVTVLGTGTVTLQGVGNVTVLGGRDRYNRG